MAKIIPLGNSIALNHYKNGSLKAISMLNAFDSYSFETTFLQSLFISDYDYEMKYGDQKVAKEMKQDQLVKKLHCGLKYLNLGGS